MIEPSAARVRTVLAEASARIGSTSDTPRLDAELLMAHALGCTREATLLDRLDAPTPPAFADLLARRLTGEPVAYITGAREFWTITLTVTPDVLIPRADSETLIEAAIAHFARREGPRTILDLGTGSGALLLAALHHWPRAHGIGIDASPAAVQVAQANARDLGLDDRARIVVGGWTGEGGPHDLILCNPPYVAAGEALPRDVADFEPASALFAGADGLDDYRTIADVLAPQLAPGGVACVEIGSAQAEAVSGLFINKGFNAGVVRDLGSHPRCLVLTR